MPGEINTNPYWEALSPRDLENYDEALSSWYLMLEVGKEITRVDNILGSPILSAFHDNRELEQARRDADNLRPHYTQLLHVFHTKMPPRSAFESEEQMSLGDS